MPEVGTCGGITCPARRRHPREASLGCWGVFPLFVEIIYFFLIIFFPLSLKQNGWQSRKLANGMEKCRLILPWS